MDDSSSFHGSAFTVSSSSTVWGPGALTGKFLKAFGERSLDLVVSVVIRRRLALIKQTLEKNPHVFRNPKKTSEWQQMYEMYTDLNELCRGCYSLSIRRAAANLIGDIVLITGPSHGIGASPTHSQWEPLLIRLKRPGGLLSVPPETVISANQHVADPSHLAASDDRDIIDQIQVGVTVEVTRSYEPSTGSSARKTSKSSPRLFKHRRSESSDCDTRSTMKDWPRKVRTEPQAGKPHQPRSTWQVARHASKTFTEIFRTIGDFMSSSQSHPMTPSTPIDKIIQGMPRYPPPSSQSLMLFKNSRFQANGTLKSQKIYPCIKAHSGPKSQPPSLTNRSSNYFAIQLSVLRLQCPALPGAASALTHSSSGQKHRTFVFDIRDELKHAREVALNLESDPPLASSMPVPWDYP